MDNSEDQKLADAIATQLTPLIERVMDGYGLAGLGIGIVKDGEVLLARGFGVRSVETGAPVTERSLFHLASVSKPFVATAIVQLWEAGRLESGCPGHYLPALFCAGGRRLPADHHPPAVEPYRRRARYGRLRLACARIRRRRA